MYTIAINNMNNMYKYHNRFNHSIYKKKYLIIDNKHFYGKKVEIKAWIGGKSFNS